MDSLIILATLTLLYTVLTQASEHGNTDPESCRYPEYMYEAPGWDGKVQREGRSSRYYIMYDNDIMLSTDYDDWNLPETEIQCVQRLSDDKVIVSMQKRQGQGVQYQCIQFIKRSSHVVQLKESELHDSLDEGQCQDWNLATNDWLFIWTSAPKHYKSCGLDGGFAITDVYSPTEDQHSCQDLSLPPRIESQCEYGKGMIIHFRYPQCIGTLEMSVIETDFVCLGSWTSGQYTFTVITDGADFLPRVWMLRFPSDTTDSFEIEFLKDIVADGKTEISQTDEYLRWKVKRQVLPSLCVDESSDCSNCFQDDGFYCQNTCGKCDKAEAQQRCTFDQDFRGEWQEASWSGSRTIQITSSLLYPASLSPFECYNFNDKESLDWLEITSRQTLVSVFKNGCRPRYSCVAINKITPSVIQYRLGQSIIWPHSENINAQEICDGAKFQDDPPPLGSTYRSQYEKFLVKDSTNHYRDYVACDFWNSTTFTMTYSDPNLEDCMGLLKQCQQDESLLILHMDSCNNRYITMKNLRCLSSTVESNERFVLVEDSKEPSLIYCFLLNSGEQTDFLYFLHASDCHINIMDDIQYGQFTNYIARFSNVVQYNTSSDCHVNDMDKPEEPEKLPTELPSTKESTTTTRYRSTDSEKLSTIDSFNSQTTQEGIISTENNAHASATQESDMNSLPSFSEAFEISTEKSVELADVSTTDIYDLTTQPDDVQRSALPDIIEAAVSSDSSKLPQKCFVLVICLYLVFL